MCGLFILPGLSLRQPPPPTEHWATCLNLAGDLISKGRLWDILGLNLPPYVLFSTCLLEEQGWSEWLFRETRPQLVASEDFQQSCARWTIAWDGCVRYVFAVGCRTA